MRPCGSSAAAKSLPSLWTLPTSPSSPPSTPAPKGDTFAPELGYDWTVSASLPANGWLTSANGTRYRITLWRRTEAK